MVLLYERFSVKVNPSYKYEMHSNNTCYATGRTDEVTGIFSIYLILPAELWPWADSAPNRNEYQEPSRGVGGGSA
jgi:hypothetical protein